MERKWFIVLSALSLLFTRCDCKKSECTQSPETNTTGIYAPKPYVELKHPEWSKNATIYEVNIRQYTPEGNFKAFESHLPRLKEMGIDIIWLMPIHPIGESHRQSIVTGKQIGRAHV